MNNQITASNALDIYRDAFKADPGSQEARDTFEEMRNAFDGIMDEEVAKGVKLTLSYESINLGTDMCPLDHDHFTEILEENLPYLNTDSEDFFESLTPTVPIDVRDYHCTVQSLIDCLSELNPTDYVAYQYFTENMLKDIMAKDEITPEHIEWANACFAGVDVQIADFDLYQD